MQAFNKGIVCIGVLLLSISVFSQKANKTSVQSIAYIEQGKILSSIQGFDRYSKEIDSLQHVYNEIIETGFSKLNEKIQELLDPYEFNSAHDLQHIKATIKPADLERLELFLQENEILEMSRKNYNLMISTLYEQRIQPILNRVNQTIQNYAQSKGITVVYIIEHLNPALAFISDQLNITDDIIKRLNTK